MSLQLVRGRELKPPLRSGREKPIASPTLLRTETQSLPRIGKPKAKPRLTFPVGPETRAFYRRFYPGTTTEGNDCHGQSQPRIRSLADLKRFFVLSPDERPPPPRHSGTLPVGITPY